MYISSFIIKIVYRKNVDKIEEDKNITILRITYYEIL